MNAPTEEERVAIRDFCSTWRQWKQSQQGLANHKNERAKEKKQFRDAMYAFMVEHDVATCKVETEQGEPRFLKTKTYTNSCAINQDIVADALSDLVLVSGSTVPDAAQTIVSAIQAQRKRTRDYVSVVKTAPRSGSTEAAPLELTNLAHRYFTAEAECADLGKELKTLDMGAKVTLDQCSTSVGRFLQRARVSSQRINLKRKLRGGGSVQESVFIRRKISRRKPRLTVPVLLDVVQSALSRYPNMLRSPAQFEGSEALLVDAIMSELDAIPPVESERISLSTK
jgi:hypothetical protein